MTEFSKEALVDLICAKLEAQQQDLTTQFHATRQQVVGHFVVDNFLPEEIANAIYHAFPNNEVMRLMDSFRERKLTYKQLDNTHVLLKNITFAIQSPRVIAIVEKITGIAKQTPDNSLYAGGISKMCKGHFLNPHLDNSHDGERNRYRTVNLLYYVSPAWKVEFGGNLELWDQKVKTPTVIASLFNRFVVMETNRKSWHSVSPVLVEKERCCVSNYYFSQQSPEGEEYFNVTSFNARPEHKIRRIYCKIDNALRHCARKISRYGFGKKDVYAQKN